MKRAAIFTVLLLVLLTFVWSAPAASPKTSLAQTGHPPATPAVNAGEGPVVSPIEGPVLSPVEGQSTGYDVSWFTVAGTGRSVSSRYTLMGTVGQPDVGPVRSSDSIYAVYGGFWPGIDLPISTYLPVVRR